MDLSNPIGSVIPTAYGPVLEVLARSGRALSGRQVAELTGGRISRTRVAEVLGELVENGIVSRDVHPPAMLYRLNREHVAAPAILQLSQLRQSLIDRIVHSVSTWAVPSPAVWLFGSAARGTGTSASDIDILVIRPDLRPAAVSHWDGQLSDFRDSIRSWSGNAGDVLELTIAEWTELLASGARLVDELSTDAVVLHGLAPQSLLDGPAPATIA